MVTALSMATMAAGTATTMVAGMVAGMVAKRMVAGMAALAVATSVAGMAARRMHCTAVKAVPGPRPRSHDWQTSFLYITPSSPRLYCNILARQKGTVIRYLF